MTFMCEYKIQTKNVWDYYSPVPHRNKEYIPVPIKKMRPNSKITKDAIPKNQNIIQNDDIFSNSVNQPGLHTELESKSEEKDVTTLSVRRIDQAAEIGTSKHPNWDQLAVAVGRQQLATNERLYIAVIDMSLTQQHLGKLVKPSVREANRYRCYFMVDYAKMFFSVIWVITIKLSVAKTTVQLPMSVRLCVLNSMNKSRHDVH